MLILHETRRFVMTFLIAAMLGCVARGVAVPTRDEDPNVQPGMVSQDPSQLRWDLADRFEFDWSSAELSSKVLKDAAPNAATCTLTIDVKVGILDAKGLVTIDVNRPEISEVYDGDGHVVEYLHDSAPSVRRYEQRGWYWDGTGARPPEHWYCGRLVLQLPSDPNHAVPSSISRLTACIHAIYGEVVNADVPFDGSRTEWLTFEATPGLLFRVDPSTPPRPGAIQYEPGPRFSARRPTAPVALYQFTTWVRSASGGAVMALRDEFPWFPRAPYPLGDYAIVRVDLFDSQRRVNTLLPKIWQWTLSDPAASPQDGARCWGQEEQDDNAYDMIRHIIAVRPVEVKIPFVLKNIPIPAVRPIGK